MTSPPSACAEYQLFPELEQWQYYSWLGTSLATSRQNIESPQHAKEFSIALNFLPQFHVATFLAYESNPVHASP